MPLSACLSANWQQWWFWLAEILKVLARCHLKPFTIRIELVFRIIVTDWNCGKLGGKSLVTLGGSNRCFRCPNSGSSNQIAEQNHVDA